jgi:hypothetical protein
MSQNKLRTVSLYQLHKMCEREDPDALFEWKRRWRADYPNIAEINKGNEKLTIPYFRK